MFLTNVLFFPFGGTSEYRKSLSFSSAMLTFSGKIY